MRGFFNPAVLTAAVPPGLLPKCGKCGLFRGCLSPKMDVIGEGRKRILVVGEAPDKAADEQGHFFVGKDGRLLRDELGRFDVDLERDCWITSALICRPPGNRTPTDKEVGYCRPNLVNAVRHLNPEKILLLGAAAVRSLFGWLWRPDVGAIGRWVGFRVPLRRPNAWACPLWHPSFLDRAQKMPDGPVVMLWFRRWLAAALALPGRPWESLPEYPVDCEMDADAAADKLAAFADSPAVAFDFETDRIKPDHPDSRLVCASVSDGARTLAFPLVGPAAPALRALLRAPVPKVGWNIKFEERWARRHLGTRVRNWKWDGMLAAHVLDNRPRITGLKFQAFVQLGQPPWDAAVAGSLTGDGESEVNRVGSARIADLLKYCGLDSALEFHVAKAQRKAMRGA